MNPNYGKSNNPQRGSVNNFDFDLGLGSTRSTSLNDKKQNTSSSYSSFSSNQSSPTNLSNRPTWVHQSAPNQANLGGLSSVPTSMVGDISGKSWSSTAPSSGIGIVVKNPNLFGDLVGSALGQGKGSNNSNAPLKSVAPVKSVAQAKNVYSMGHMADSLPKMNSVGNSSGNNWGSSEKFGASTSLYGGSDNSNNSISLGGPSMHKYGGGLGSSNKDPFGSLVDFTSKPSANLNAVKTSKPVKEDDLFGGFQNASKSNTQSFGSNSFVGSTPVSDFKTDCFEMPTMNYTSQNLPPVQASSNVDPLDMLFSATSSSAEAGMAVAEGVDDWCMESEFPGGNDGGGMTTEIEGLPPPPAGVNASLAKNKGMDNYKQGQYADAIKWLSWAVILLAKNGDNDAHMEVLSSRASCYKEVGEYKKAVADCTKVLEHDGKNVSVLVQRALLYESIEKYRLGAEDLRMVLRIDPSNRVARSTVHRLNKMAD